MGPLARSLWCNININIKLDFGSLKNMMAHTNWSRISRSAMANHVGIDQKSKKNGNLIMDILCKIKNPTWLLCSMGGLRAFFHYHSNKECSIRKGYRPGLIIGNSITELCFLMQVIRLQNNRGQILARNHQSKDG